MKILQMCVGMFATNCYIVFDEDTKEGAVIDPGANAEGILQAAEQAQVKLTWVLLTHGHFDHILAVRDIQKATGAKLAIHKDELWLLKKEILEGSIQTFGLSRRDDYEELTPDLLAEEGTEIAIGNLTATYLQYSGTYPRLQLYSGWRCIIYRGYPVPS